MNRTDRVTTGTAMTLCGLLCIAPLVLVATLAGWITGAVAGVIGVLGALAIAALIVILIRRRRVRADG